MQVSKFASHTELDPISNLRSFGSLRMTVSVSSLQSSDLQISNLQISTTTLVSILPLRYNPPTSIYEETT